MGSHEAAQLGQTITLPTGPLLKGRAPGRRKVTRSRRQQPGTQLAMTRRRAYTKNPATTYFLGPQTDIIGARGLTAVFGMGTGVSHSL